MGTFDIHTMRIIPLSDYMNTISSTSCNAQLQLSNSILHMYVTYFSIAGEQTEAECLCSYPRTHTPRTSPIPH